MNEQAHAMKCVRTSADRTRILITVCRLVAMVGVTSVSVRAFTIAAALIGAVGSAGSAQAYDRIQNRWKPEQYLHIEYGKIESGSIKPEWWSAQWTTEQVPGTAYVRFKNRWKPDQYLHIERFLDPRSRRFKVGALVSGPVDPTSFQAMWTLEPAEAGFHRIRNRFSETYIHIESGALAHGAIQPAWWSAQWRIASDENQIQRPIPPIPPLLGSFSITLKLTSQQPVAYNTSPQFAWSLSNRTQTAAEGKLEVSVDNKAVTPVPSLPSVQGLLPWQSRSGNFSLPPLSPGDHNVSLEFHRLDGMIKLPHPGGGFVSKPVYVNAARAEVGVVISNAPNLDSDGDGLGDQFEGEILSRFRPFYKFSLDSGPDPYHPADARWFVSNSDLLYPPGISPGYLIPKSTLSLKPEQVLLGFTNTFGYTDWRKQGNKKVTEYRLDVADNLWAGEANWTRVKHEAVGLYGHVAPLPDGAIKVEYWQFFAYNDAIADSYTHEGDWETVQLVIEKDGRTIRRVIHEVHGKQIVFDLSGANFNDIGGGIREYTGSGPHRPHRGRIDLHIDGPAGIGWAQQNIVRIYCHRGECTHPVVYIEHSGHAFWPTEYWNWIGARKHSGDGESYLVATPPNLGELSSANSDCPGAEIILHYNGRWGAKNEGPEGPGMKWQWSHPFAQP